MPQIVKQECNFPVSSCIISKCFRTFSPAARRNILLGRHQFSQLSLWSYWSFLELPPKRQYGFCIFPDDKGLMGSRTARQCPEENALSRQRLCFPSAISSSHDVLKSFPAEGHQKKRLAFNSRLLAGSGEAPRYQDWGALGTLGEKSPHLPVWMTYFDGRASSFPF